MININSLSTNFLLIFGKLLKEITNFVSSQTPIMIGLPEKYSVSNKTIELILYNASELKDKPTYGSTLLEKSLFLCDSMSYLKLGKPITDFKYVKQDFGPVPEPGKYLFIRDKLIANGDLEILKIPYYNTIQKRPVSKREPKMDVFDKEEIVLINEVIKWFGEKNATDVSNFTHDLLAWQLAQKNEELPFYTFLLTSKPPDDGDREASIKTIKKYLASHRNE